MPDSVYEDKQMVDWYRNNKIASARYPGGTPAANWNWEWPSGRMGTWSMDPNKKPIKRETEDGEVYFSDQADPSEWMSMEEYMDFVNKTGMTPNIGVNYKCGGGGGEEWPHCQLDERCNHCCANFCLLFVQNH